MHTNAAPAFGDGQLTIVMSANEFTKGYNSLRDA